MNLMPSGSCGAFVHGLEDEFLGKCTVGHKSHDPLLPCWADDIRTKHAFVWGDLNARNQPNAFSYGQT